MPFAPPVTIAVRPDSLAIALLLRVHAADEFFELRELLLDHADGRLVLELERLLVEFLRGEGDDDLGPAEKDDVDRGRRLPQVIFMREPPRMPPAADCSVTGLSLNGCSFMR